VPSRRHPLSDAQNGYSRVIVTLMAGIKSCENRNNHIKLRENCHALRGLIDSALEANVCRTRDLNGGQTGRSCELFVGSGHKEPTK